jgi:precorrin-4 methylase
MLFRKGHCWPYFSALPSSRRDLIPAYGADCPVAGGPQGTCPDQKIVTGALANIRAK